MALMFWPQYEVVFRKLRLNGEVQQLFHSLHFTMNTLRRTAGYSCYLDTQFIIDPQQNFCVPSKKASIGVWPNEPSLATPILEQCVLGNADICRYSKQDIQRKSNT